MNLPPPETVEVDFITPRHLAGRGDPAWVTVPLHRACGWSHSDDPLMPRVLLSSPDQQAVLRLEPDPDGQWWTLHHAAQPDRPAWYASFGARTPAELIAAFTDALTDPSATASTPSDPYEPLRHVDWSLNAGGMGLGSPDRTAYTERLGNSDEPGAWFVTASLGPEHPPLWQARFGEHTPPHLITAFTTALADPSPVLRTACFRSLPTRDPALVTRRTYDVPAPDFDSLVLDHRIRSLSARRTGLPAGPSPVQPPAKNRRSR